MKDAERAEESSAADDEDIGSDDRRLYVRFPFKGCPFPVHIDGVTSTIRLRDLSCGGASCFSETPVTVGETVYLELDRKHIVAAEVRWVRRLSVGLRFVNALDPMLVRRIHADQTPPRRPFGR